MTQPVSTGEVDLSAMRLTDIPAEISEQPNLNDNNLHIGLKEDAFTNLTNMSLESNGLPEIVSGHWPVSRN